MSDSQHPTSLVYEGSDPDPLARIGEIVGGRYRLLEFIGQGGMGNVFRGEHTTIRKPIALKLLHPSLANIPELRSRFEREAFAIGRINHPNCVEVFDFGQLQDGSLFLAMEYLDGESAADLLDRERPLDPARALIIIRHVLSGLGHAHMVGIVHRDIKPENIFILRGDGVFAKVLDFGIAKLLDAVDDSDGREKLTQAGITFGTPAYLSPEQALGDPADRRSDLYSVAVVLYELLTGTPPFRSPDKMELLAMHANREAPSLSDGAPHLRFHPALEAVVAKGLSKRRKARYQNAEEFIAAIDDLGMFPRPPSATDGSTGSLRHLTPLPVHAGAVPAEAPKSPRALKGASKGKWIAIAFGVVAAAIALTIYLILEQRPRLLADVKPIEVSDVTKKAQEVHDEGAPKKAIALLTQDDSSDTDASAQLLIGHAQASQAKYDEALVAYARALKLDENSIRDAEMITSLRIMIDDNGPIYFEALRLLVVYGDDEAAIDRLAELATHKKIKIRKEAFALAEELGHTDKIDRVESFLLDLAQEPTCEERRAAVTKLRALGDKRAAKALEKARYRRGKKKGRRSYENANGCLSAAARDAARFLRSK